MFKTLTILNGNCHGSMRWLQFNHQSFYK